MGGPGCYRRAPGPGRPQEVAIYHPDKCDSHFLGIPDRGWIALGMLVLSICWYRYPAAWLLYVIGMALWALSWVDDSDSRHAVWIGFGGSAVLLAVAVVAILTQIRL